jgi:hypothetical protein
MARSNLNRAFEFSAPTFCGQRVDISQFPLRHKNQFNVEFVGSEMRQRSHVRWVLVQYQSDWAHSSIFTKKQEKSQKDVLINPSTFRMVSYLSQILAELFMALWCEAFRNQK